MLSDNSFHRNLLLMRGILAFIHYTSEKDHETHTKFHGDKYYVAKLYTWKYESFDKSLKGDYVRVRYNAKCSICKINIKIALLLVVIFFSKDSSNNVGLMIAGHVIVLVKRYLDHFVAFIMRGNGIPAQHFWTNFMMLSSINLVWFLITYSGEKLGCPYEIDKTSSSSKHPHDN